MLCARRAFSVSHVLARAGVGGANAAYRMPLLCTVANERVTDNRFE